jgi:carbon-monoxide dehydrogenase medium subunit
VKPAPFDYHAPTSVSDVVELLSQYGDDAKVLAGGQSLVPMLALRLARFDHLVDLGRISELRQVERSNGALRVGAMAPQGAIERNPDVAPLVPLLARATPLIGHFQIRNRGTVGGSLAHADPAAEYPAVALALDVDLEVVGASGARRIAAKDFFVSTWTTALAEDDLLVAAHFPIWSGRVGFSIQEVARRAGDFALTGAACGVELGNNGEIRRCGIGMFGMAGTPVRASAAESMLTGSAPSRSDLGEIGRLAVDGLDPPDDIHASGAYRRRVGAVMVERVLSQAIEEASRG